MEDKEYHRPRKPYVYDNSKNLQRDRDSRDSRDSRPKKDFKDHKKVVVPKSNNQHNHLFKEAMQLKSMIKVYVNNLMCSDESQPAVVVGRVVGYDDYTIEIQDGQRMFLVNKGSYSMIEFLPPDFTNEQTD